MQRPLTTMMRMMHLTSLICTNHIKRPYNIVGKPVKRLCVWVSLYIYIYSMTETINYLGMLHLALHKCVHKYGIYRVTVEAII